MPTITDIAQNIYNIARAGTTINPGLPPALAELVVSQSKHETAIWKNGVMVPYSSPVFIMDHNAVGYKYSGSKYQLGTGITSPEGDAYGLYKTYQDSIRELVDWIYRRLKEGKFPALSTITTPKQYADLLKACGYYGDTVEHYLTGLKKWLVKMAGSKKGVLIAAAALIVIGWYISKKIK